MPEEINRIVADRLSDLCFCPSQAAMEQLGREGLGDGARLVGDVMKDAVLTFLPEARRLPAIPDVPSGPYAVATLHRPSNVDRADTLKRCMQMLSSVELPVVFPIHPRTRARVEQYPVAIPDNVRTVNPLGYLTMLRLLDGASLLLTDSGGLQKEALWLKVRCLTLRETTEWPETLTGGWNTLVGNDPDRLAAALATGTSDMPAQPYGKGDAADRIVDYLLAAR